MIAVGMDGGILNDIQRQPNGCLGGPPISQTFGIALTPDNQAFAARLKQALKRGPKRIDSPSELALQFNLNHPGSQITNQAAQKWLAGLTKPTPDKIQTLAAMLNVSAQWLRYGIPEARPAVAPATTAELRLESLTPSDVTLLQHYHRLSEHQQRLIADLVEQLALDRAMWVTSPEDPS